MNEFTEIADKNFLIGLYTVGEVDEDSIEELVEELQDTLMNSGDVQALKNLMNAYEEYREFLDFVDTMEGGFRYYENT